jgi:tetratricopeptide (TPR) repeat protein
MTSAIAVVIAALLLLSGCGARHAAAVVSNAASDQRPVDVSALIARGCFTCLEQAYAAAERTNGAQAFEAAVLLAFRAKELGLPFEPWLDRAGALADADDARRVYLEIATAIPVDPLSGDRDAIFTSTPSRTQLLDRLRDARQRLVSAPGSEAFREYVSLSLACAADKYEEMAAAVDRTLETFADVPLVRYRAGLCRTKGPSVLEAVRQSDSDFVDADYPLGVYALGARPNPDYDVALSRMTAAAVAFPQSPAIRNVLGEVHRTREEWPQALAAYDETIVLVPTHRDALLGRTVALSRLDRQEEAIAAATRLIDLGGWYVGQAYYWRAWNEFRLRRLEVARSDTDRAKGQMINSAVSLLSGLIEWHMHHLDTAEREFEESRRLDGTECDASFNLGGVRMERGDLDAALEPFTRARTCFDEAIAALRRRIDAINAGPGGVEVKTRLVDRQQQTITEASVRLEQATRNAADIERRVKARHEEPRRR